jgi:hypothetical protein
MHILAEEFGTGQVFWTFVWFFLFFIWIWLLIMVFSDIFRSHDLSGWAKALWILFIIILPYLGVLVYFIARGKQMTQHAQETAAAQDAAARQYIQTAVAQGGSGTSSADELAKLADLKAKGVISDAEFESAKAKILA